MKLNKIFLVLSVLAIVFSGCMREEDKDLLNRPIHIKGQIDPHFGIPIASTSLQIEDVLRLLGNNYTQYLEQSTSPNDLVRIKFDTVFVNKFEFENASITPKSASKSKSGEDGYAYIYDSIIEGEQTFGLLENIDILNNFSITQVLLSWTAQVQLDASKDLHDLVNESNLIVYVDNLILVAENTTTHDCDTIPINNRQAIILDTTIIKGNPIDIPILSNEDASTILTIKPNKIKYSAQVHMRVPHSLFAMDITEHLQDTLTINSMSVKSSINAKFPVNVKVKHFEQTLDTIPLNVGGSIDTLMQQLDSIEFLEAQVLDSYIILKIKNSLPLDASMKVDVCDDLGSSLFLLVDTTTQFIKAADIVPYEKDPSLYVSKGESTSEIKILINHDRILQLRNAKYILMTTTLNTPDVVSANGTREQKQVAPRRSNGLGVNIYAKIHAKANIDMPLTDKPLINKGGEK